MIDSVTSVPAGPVATSTASEIPNARANTAASAPTSPVQSASKSEAPTAGTRLYVEQQGDRYVYRVVDVATGRLLLEVPREQMDDLKSFAQATGAPLISTTA